MKRVYETVYTITDFYDGPRKGIADFNGKPHLYECVFDDATDDWSDIYLLQPTEEATFKMAMEDWQIWRRWEAAFKTGQAHLSTHPALPEDRHRHEELKRLLQSRLQILPINAHRAKAESVAAKDYPEGQVHWTVVQMAEPDARLTLLYSMGVDAGASLTDEQLRRKSLYDDHN